MGLGSNPTGRVDFPFESVAIDEALVSGLVSPCGVAVDGGHLYWASPGGMTIGRANLDGSAPDRTFISGVSSPCGVAVDGSHIYWGSFQGDSIGRANLDGDEVDEALVEGAAGPCGVAVDGAHVYWANWDGSTIGRANLDGSGPEHAFIAGLDSPCGVAVDGSHIFWTNWNARDPVGRARPRRQRRGQVARQHRVLSAPPAASPSTRGPSGAAPAPFGAVLPRKTETRRKARHRLRHGEGGERGWRHPGRRLEGPALEASRPPDG